MAEEERVLLALEDTASTGVRVASLRILGAGVAFITSIVVARALGPTGRGLYALPVAFLGIVMAVSHVGLESSNVFLAGRGVTLRRLWATNALGALIFSVLAWVMVAGLGVLAGPDSLGGLPTSWIVVAMAQLPLLLTSLYWMSLLQLEGSYAAAARVAVAAAVAHAGMVLAFAVLGRLTPFTVLALTWVTAAVTWALVLRLGARRRIAGTSTDRTLLAGSIAFGLRAQLATVFTFLLLRVDQVLVQRMLGFRELGLYAITVVLAELLWLVTDPFAGSLLRHQVVADPYDERRLGYATARLGLVVASVLCAIAWIAAPLVIRVAYGSAFLDATWPVRWLLPGVAAIAAQRPLYAVVTKQGRMGLAAAMNAVALAANVALNVWLLPLVGVVGAAIASSVTYLLLGVGYVLVTRVPGVAGWRDLVPHRDDLRRLVGGMVRAVRAREQVASEVPPRTEPSPPGTTQGAPVAGDVVDRCPLCRGTDASPVTTVPFSEIWQALRAQWNVTLEGDLLARHQPNAEAELVGCEACGLEYFMGALPGDSVYYAHLMEVLPYHGDRWEFAIVLPSLALGAAVADLGCGEGAFLRLASQRAGHSVGVDQNPVAIDALIGAGLEGTTESFTSFAEREPASFDVVCSFHTLEHIPDVGDAVRAARRLLRPGGRFFVSVPNRDRYGRRDAEPLDCPPHHLSRWSVRQLHELAERFHLDLVAVHREPPDLSHAREAAIERSSALRRLGIDDGHRLVARLWARAAVRQRHHERAIADGEYVSRGVFGHSMLAELQRPNDPSGA
jgi:O-antigen/teichoic acid export membrane protein/SAM-dependent methyltransferase